MSTCTNLSDHHTGNTDFLWPIIKNRKQVKHPVAKYDFFSFPWNVDYCTPTQNFCIVLFSLYLYLYLKPESLDPTLLFFILLKLSFSFFLVSMIIYPDPILISDYQFYFWRPHSPFFKVDHSKVLKKALLSHLGLARSPSRPFQHQELNTIQSMTSQNITSNNKTARHTLFYHPNKRSVVLS